MKPRQYARSAAFFASLAIVCGCAAQSAPAIDWTYRAGGSLNDNAYSIVATADGGSIVAGQVIPVAEGTLGGDAWVTKLDADGGVEWSETYGGSGYDRARSIIELAEGGYLFVGGTNSDDGDVEGHQGGGDYWVVRLSENGSLLWQRCFGGTDLDVALCVVQINTGEFVITGEARSIDGDVTNSHGITDMWVIKLNENGTLLWEHALGGSTSDAGFAVIQSLDGGFISVGTTTSSDGDVTGFHGLYDYWVVKLSSEGQMLWQKALGGTDQDIATAVSERPQDGGIAVIGDSFSSDGDISNAHGDRDAWVAILSTEGELQSERSCGGSAVDFARSIVLYFGDWLVAGTTSSEDGDLENNNGDNDIWLFRLNAVDDLVWIANYGGEGSDGCNAMALAVDGGIYVAGGTASNSFSPPAQGGFDCFAMKLERDDVGLIDTAEEASISLFPNPASTFVVLCHDARLQVDVELWSSSGQLLLTTRSVSSQTQLDVSACSPGTYFVRVKNEHGSDLRQVFVKE